MIYSSKDFPFGFVVFCQKANNLGCLKTTLNSIECHYSERPCVTVVPEDVNEADLRLLKVGLVVRNGGSPAAQINAGIAGAPWGEWCLVVQAGTWVRNLLDVKFSHFMDSEKDILFPVVGKITSFAEAAWTGTLIHKSAVEELGPFPENNAEEFCKLLWTIDAIERGYKFKGIVGATLG